MTAEKDAKGGAPATKSRVGTRAPDPPLPVTYVSNRVRVGLNGRNDFDYTDLDYRIVRNAKIETLKTMSQTKVDVYKRLRQENPGLEFIVRLYDDRMGTGHTHPTPAEFAARMIPVIKSLQPYAAKFEVHNEPNHQAMYEGWGAGLDDAASFNTWFKDVFSRLKTACPWAQLGFPGLALHHGGWRGDLPWVKLCSESVRLADWLGVHCFWQQENQLSFDWGLYFTEYHKLFPDKPLEVTEFGNSTDNLGRFVQANHYVQYYNALQAFGDYVRSASSFIATSPDPAWTNFFWADTAAKQEYPVVQAVGAMPRTQIVSEEPIDKLAGMKDLRALLPLRAGAMPYDKRDVKELTYIVVHHTAGGSSWTAQDLAAWDVTQTDRDPYPEITYHFVVDADGTIERCHALDALAWHAGARGLPSPGSVGINNWKGVAVCLPGNFMGTAEPSDVQLQSAARLCQAILKIVPGAEIVGHRDIVPAGNTSCPGDTWAPSAGGGYRDRLLAMVTGVQPPRRIYAYVLAHQTGTQMDTGANTAVAVTVRNTGSKTWNAAGANAVHLSYHWVDASGGLVVFDGERTNLPNDLAPDQEAVLQATVKAPAVPGAYTLQWDMVEEFITWFSQQGVPTTNVTVNVVPVAAPAPPAWKAFASTASVDAPNVLDGDPSTNWSTGALPPIAWFMIDLGSLQMVGGFKAESPAGSFPHGFALSVSPDGKAWTEVVRQLDSQGDVDVTFDAVKARYVRLDYALAAWTISAIAIQTRPAPAWSVTASLNPADASKAIDGSPSTFWTTGTGQVPGMWFQLDLGTAQHVKRLALAGPKDDTPRGYKISASVDGLAWREAYAKPLNYAAVDAALPLPLARYLKVEIITADQFNRPWSISEISADSTSAWVVKTSHNSAKAGLAIDGDPATAWRTAEAQVPGMWIELDLGEVLTVGKVVLESLEKEFPRGLAVSVSTDGKLWTEAGRVERFYAGPVEVPFAAPVSTRYLHMEQTSDVVLVGKWGLAWSVTEIGVFLV